MLHPEWRRYGNRVADCIKHLIRKHTIGWTVEREAVSLFNMVQRISNMNTPQEWGQDFFNSGEWQVCDERLADLAAAKIVFCPSRENLFRALDLTPLEKAKVVIVGQDPYPNPKHATGVAFSIPKKVKEIPRTLVNIMREYSDDLHYPFPKHGNLEKWCKQGVLLWNATPTCEQGKPGSHADWPEWTYLNREICQQASKQGVVFALLGRVAQECRKYIDEGKSTVLEVSHPSPRGVLHSRSPFLGSRLFTTINQELNKLGKGPVDWRL